MICIIFRNALLRHYDAVKNEFFPKGAIAFFLAMIAFFSVVWLGIYALMLSRA